MKIHEKRNLHNWREENTTPALLAVIWLIAMCAAVYALVALMQ
jgi:hypothetical protein